MKQTRNKQKNKSSFTSYIKKVKKSRWLFFMVGVIIIAFLIISIINKNNKKQYLRTVILKEVITKITNNPQIKFTVDDLNEKSGVYQFNLTINNNNNPQKYTSYITKDGKILFTSGIEIDKLLNKTQQLTCNDLDKKSSPKLTAFIMANCPYGLQMQRVFKKIIESEPDIKNYLQVKYIFNQDSNFETGKLTALHGEDEAKENLRQICLREEQSSVYWSYVSCYMKKPNNTENCLTLAQVDQIQLNQCLNDKNRGLKYAKLDFYESTLYSIQGSPTLLLNSKQIVSEFDFGGRTQNAIKEILCCSSDKKLSFCNKKFSKNNIALSFSETDEETNNSSTSNAGCK